MKLRYTVTSCHDDIFPLKQIFIILYIGFYLKTEADTAPEKIVKYSSALHGKYLTISRVSQIYIKIREEELKTKAFIVILF